MTEQSNKSHVLLGTRGLLWLRWLPAPQHPRDDTAITIYSSAQPGAISPEYYRPLPGQGTPNAMGVPGYRDGAPRAHGAASRPAARSLRFTDVAALIDPTTVTFTSLTDPATRVLEQNFQFDLVSTDKLLQKYIDRPLTRRAQRRQGAVTSITGTLLSSADGLVLRGNDGTITALRDYSARALPGTAGRPDHAADAACGTSTRRARRSAPGARHLPDGRHHLVGRLQPDLQRRRDANSGFVDVAAWVSIINQSGASYPEAQPQADRGRREPRAAAPDPQGVTMAMARDGAWPMTRASRRSRSTSSISTRSAAAPRCRTTRPSRSSCSSRRAGAGAAPARVRELGRLFRSAARPMRTATSRARATRRSTPTSRSATTGRGPRRAAAGRPHARLARSMRRTDRSSSSART